MNRYNHKYLEDMKLFDTESLKDLGQKLIAQQERIEKEELELELQEELLQLQKGEIKAWIYKKS